MPSLPRLLAALTVMLLCAGDAGARPRAPASPAADASVEQVQFWGNDQTRRERRAGQDRRPGVFRFLFRERQQEAVPFAPEWNPGQVQPRPRQASKPRREKRKRPAAPAAPKIVAVEKAPDAKRILVIGDFFAGALAKGLTASHIQDAKTVVLDRSSGSSGLARREYQDWADELSKRLQEDRPDAILLLVGANDRQSIATADGAREIGSDGWRAEYASRVSRLADALNGTGKPVLWAGLAPVRSAAMSRDYSMLNGIIREQLEGKGLRFVETWNGFADEEGKFVSVGPDINGQKVQLRNSDGLNFTKAGQRKLAYFVDQQLADLMGASVEGALSISATGLGGSEPADEGPKIGPMVPIDALVLSGDDALSGAPAQSGPVTAGLAGENASASTPAGRADNYVWPPPPLQQPTPTAAPTPAAASAAAPPGTAAPVPLLPVR